MMYTCLLLLTFLTQVTADQLPCQDDYAEIVNGSRRCFRYYKCDRQVCSVDVARRHCESQGAFLASDLTAEDHEYFVSTMNEDTGKFRSILLGGRKTSTGTWLWADGKPANGPWWKNGTRHRNCMLMYYGDKLWHSQRCHTKLVSANIAYICERPPSYKGRRACIDGWTVYMGRCVSVQTCSDCSRDVAVAHCHSTASGRLVTSKWQSDDEFYLKLLEREYNNKIYPFDIKTRKILFFLGAQKIKNGIWKWSDGTPMSSDYHNWNNGSPEEGDAPSYCLTLSRTDKKWHSRDCTKMHDYASVMCYRNL